MKTMKKSRKIALALSLMLSWSFAFAQTQNTIPAPVSVTSMPIVVNIQSQSANYVYVNENSDTCLFVNTDIQPMAYIWKKNDNGTWIDAANDDSDTLFFTNITASDTGIYRCTVVDGCENKYSNEIHLQLVPEDIEISEQPQSQLVCAGSDLDLSVTAGGDNINYQWYFNEDELENDTLSTLSFNPVTSSYEGAYFCKLYNDNDTVFTDTVTISVSDIQLDITKQDITCFSAADGKIFVEASEGIGTINYAWDNGCVTDSITGLGSGDYSLTVSDSICSVDTSINIVEPVQLSLEIELTQPNCNTSNGEATASVSGGTGNYTYLWSNGSTDDSADSLASGTHSVLITDANGCTLHRFFSLADSDAPTVTLSVQNALCHGTASGSITADVTGGQTPYTFAWSNGSTTPTASNLSAGNHELLLTDSNNCQTIKTAVVGQASAISINGTITDATCGNADGEIILDVIGGTGNYTYNWSNDEETANITALASGNYTVSVSDENNCTKTKTFTVNNTDGPVITLDSVVSANCGAPGAIYVSVSGGSGAYSYQWSNNYFNEDLIGFTPGEYTLTVTDGACSAILNTEIPSHEPQMQPICLVTVDSAISANMVVWEKEQNNNISHYNIYRETFMPNDFALVGEVAYADMSEFVDSVANPFIRSFSYSISAVDVCGNESELSPAHKTIHLTMNQGMGQSYNLIWDDYSGFEYYWFNVLRHTNQSGWELIQQMPKTLHSYTDVPPSQGGLRYTVTVESPEACEPWSLDKSVGGPYSQSTSNIEDIGIIDPTSISTTSDMGLYIYPNPANQSVNIYIPSTEKTEMQLIITDISGKVVHNVIANEVKQSIDVSALSPGMYFIELRGNKIYKEKLIVK